MRSRIPGSNEIEYMKSPEVISGIELNADGHKVAWSLGDYLNDLEEEMTREIDRMTAPKPKPKEKPAPKKPEASEKKQPEEETTPKAGEKPADEKPETQVKAKNEPEAKPENVQDKKNEQAKENG